MNDQLFILPRTIRFLFSEYVLWLVDLSIAFYISAGMKTFGLPGMLPPEEQNHLELLLILEEIDRKNKFFT
jgi:hypothetical protein